MEKLSMLLVLSLRIAMSACSYNVPTKVSPATNIYSSYEGKIPGKFIVVNDSTMKDIHKSIKSSTYLCSAHKFQLDIDNKLADSVFETADMSIENVLERDEMIDKKNHE